MQMPPYINIHTHHKPLASNEMVIRNAWLCPQKMQGDNYLFSHGIHPWFVKEMDWQASQSLWTKLLAEPGMVAIGETGLDRLKPLWELQLTLFEKQVELAAKHHKPLIIHCVKAYYDLIPFIKKTKTAFILHGFEGNINESGELAKHQNVFFSFGPRQFKNALKVQQNLEYLGSAKIFFETDTNRVPVEHVYTEALQYLKLSKEELIIQIHKNYSQAFNQTN